MPSRREDIVDEFLSDCTDDVGAIVHDSAERSWYPGCSTIEAVHLLVALRQCDVDYFDVGRIANSEGFEAFRPSHTALVNAIRQVMPAKKDRGRGEMQYGRTALAALKSAQELAGSDAVEMSHLFLALLLRNDIQAVLCKAGYTSQEVRLLKQEMVEVCIKRSGATRPRASLQESHAKTLFVLQNITPEQMAKLRRGGVEAKFFSQKGCPVEGIAVEGKELASACSVLQLEPFARKCVFFTEREGVFHTALRQKSRQRVPYDTTCDIEEMEDIVCQGDGWDVGGDFKLSIESAFKEHVASRVEASVSITDFDYFNVDSEDDDEGVFRVGFTFWHRDMRSAWRAFEDSGITETDGRYPVRVSLSTEEVRRATKYVLGSDDPAFVYADVYERSMMIRMHCGLFKEHGTRTILLDSLLRKCAPHLRPDMRLPDLVNSIPTDDLPAAPEKNLTLVGFYDDGKRKAYLKALVHGVFMRGLKGKVEVRDRVTAQNENVPDDGKFHVYLSHGTAAEQYPVGERLPLIDESGSIIGELEDRGLRIYKDFLQGGGFDGVHELAKFLRMARTQRLMASRSSKAKQMVAQKFITECLFALKTCKPDANKKKTTTRLKQAGEEVVAQIERARNLEYRVAEANLTADSEFGPEFDSLMELEKVKSVKVTESHLIVHTHTIFCRDDRTKRVHELGEFEISIPFDTSNRVTFVNQTRFIEAGSSRYYAPHVAISGYPCLGNIEGTLPDLVRKRLFVPAVQVCIAFLESANTSDAWGSNVHLFPLANRRR